MSRGTTDAEKRAKRAYRQRRRDLFAAMKNKPCKRCGGKFVPEAMDYHHKPGTEKEFAITTAIMSGLALDRIHDEIAKCELICSNCHRAEHARLRCAILGT